MAAPQNGQATGEPVETIEITLTTSKTLGNPDKIQGVIGVYMKSGVSGDKVPFCIRGQIYTVAKATGSWTKGACIYHHSTNTNFSTAATNGKLAGFAAAAKATAATQGLVYLHGAAIA